MFSFCVSISVSLFLSPPCMPPSLSCSLCLTAVPKPRHNVCLSCVGSVLKSAVPLPACSFPMTSSPQTLFMLSRFASSLPFPLWVQSSGLLSICESLCWLFAVWWLNVDCGGSRTRVVFAWTSTVHLEPQQPPRVNHSNHPESTAATPAFLRFQLGPIVLLSSSPIFSRNSQPILSPVPQSTSQLENLS